MISGAVNAGLEAAIRLEVLGADGQQRVEAIIDAGFSGFLTLPPALIMLLRLTWLAREPSILADGTVGLFDLYRATVIWDGRARTVEVNAAGAEPLLGMAMLQGYDVCMQVRAGGTVTIAALP